MSSRPWTTPEVEECARMWREGLYLDEIAWCLRRRRNSVRAQVLALIRLGRIERRHAGRPRLVRDVEAIVAGRARGLSVPELAMRYDCSVTTIDKYLREARRGD